MHSCGLAFLVLLSKCVRACVNARACLYVLSGRVSACLCVN